VGQTRGQEDEEIIHSSKYEQEGFEWVDISNRDGNSGLHISGHAHSLDFSSTHVRRNFLDVRLVDGQGFVWV